MPSVYFIVAVLSVLIIALGFLVIRLEIRLRKLLRGKNAESLEGILTDMAKELDKHSAFRGDLEIYLKDVESRLNKSIKHVETVRFNPFDNAGSNQSFATALLDTHGDGVVISSLYSRDKVGIYAKPVKAHMSEYSLSDEESQAIDRARPKK